MSANLQKPTFTDENKAREALEAVRWPNGPICPHCGSVDGIAKAQGKSARPGLYYCAACNDQFTVTVGTVMERSKIPLTKWWLAMHLMGVGKKGTSAHQMHRMLGVTYKTAWFMCHRIREAMREGGLTPMGGSGKIVEADETYYGERDGAHVSKQRQGRAYKRRKHVGTKRAIVALVERGGSVRSFHPPVADVENVAAIVRENVARETRLKKEPDGWTTGLPIHVN